MRIFHAADIHFCPKYLDEVRRCFGYAIQHSGDASCALLTGDLFDSRLEQNSPALLAAVDAVRSLATQMPVLVLQGTYSHDAPGAIDLLRRIREVHPVFVVDRICQVILWFNKDGRGQWMFSDGWSFENFPRTPEPPALLISCLPSVNKGAIAAAVGVENAAEATGQYVAKLLAGWNPTNTLARTLEVPTVTVSHGTVNGCITESGVPMAGMDHEFTTGSLFASGADAIMLGHIHKHQGWRQGGQAIAYSGSIGRFHYGEIDEKGALLWNVVPGNATFERIITPARRFMDVIFDGLPDLNQMPAPENVKDAFVRVRYSVDEEHRSAVNREALRQTLLDAGAADVKIEPKINPIQRQRAAGIGCAQSIADQIKRWCELTNTEPSPLIERLHQLEAS